MPRNTSHTLRRNNDIRKRFGFHKKRNPKFTQFAIIELVAIEFYLEPVTIGKILYACGEDVPVTDTIVKHMRQAATA